MPDVFGCTCVELVCVLLIVAAHETAGATAPGIPCALISSRDTNDAEPGRKSRRGNADARHCEERSDEAIQTIPAGGTVDCFASLAMTTEELFDN